ncbi:hypothetical protein LCGC14_2128000, partial [marine sediment metagenome]
GGSNLGIVMRGADNCIIRNNVFSGHSNISIFGENNSSNCLIEGNTITATDGNSGAHGIAFHGTTSSQNVDRTRIIGNDITIANAASFGIEVGAFGGNNPDQVVVSGNVITGGAAAHGGGISFSSVDGGTITGNSYDSNAQTVTIAGIEVVASTNVTVGSNQVLGAAGLLSGITLNRSSYCSVAGNVIDGFGNATNDRGIYIFSNNDTLNTQSNSVNGNTIRFGASSGTNHKGIYLQCNNASTDCSNNSIIGNIIHGNSGAATRGIAIQHDAGTLDRTLILGNQILNVLIGIDRESGQTGTQILENVFGGIGSSDLGGTAGSGEVAVRLNPVLGQLNIASQLQLASGVLKDGGGFKHARIASGTTAASLHATASATWTFTTAFADANYTLTATIDNPTGIPIVAHTDNKVAGSIDIIIMAGSAAAASGTLNCIAIHD